MAEHQRLAAVILAAGKGTRMKSKTPKVLHRVAGRPLAHWVVQAAIDAGCAPVVVVVGHGSDAVTASLTEAFGDRVRTTVQHDQKGTGHAAQIGLEALPTSSDGHGSVMILCGDTPLIRADRLAELGRLVTPERAEGPPLAMWTSHVDDPAGYGRVIRDENGCVVEIVEHKDASSDQREIREVNPAVYVGRIAFMKEALAGLKDDNAQGELYLTDVVQAAAKIDGDVPTVEVPFAETLGVNDRTQLAESTTLLRRRMLDAHMREGVAIENPASTWIEAGVAIGQDTVIEPMVSLRGATTIGADCRIGQGSVLFDAVLEDGVEVLPYSIFESCHVGPKATVGPFARLRPQSRLEEGSKVGNFVEMKKSTLGKGSKANHLSYIGDATVGEDVNIGAGTITCNYDGIGKHQTVLHDGVFIGSNSTLVAPVTVGARAYVGAGSTIGRDVPEGALGIGRTRQENKEGYADRLRKRNAARKKAKATGSKAETK